MSGIDYALSQGAAIDSCDKRGETPLTAACREGNFASLEKLVKRGANLEKRECYENQTVLQIAVRYQFQLVIVE